MYQGAACVPETRLERADHFWSAATGLSGRFSGLLLHRRLHTGLITQCGRIHVELLPAYAPELNPIEYVWGYWKRNPLANYAPIDLDDLVEQARRHGRSIQRRRELLKSLVCHAPFYLPLIGH